MVIAELLGNFLIQNYTSQSMHLRNWIFFSILFLLISCGKRLNPRIYIADEHKYEIRKGEFKGNSEMKELSFPNGQLKEQGNYAYDNKRSLSDLKIDEWSSYYENGQLKSKGKYNIGTYIQCCFSGACKQFYNYKIDFWEYFHSNGQVKAAGEYQTRQMHVVTSCEGGDDIPFGVTTSKWNYFNELGDIIEPADELIIELETVNTGGNTLASYFFPDSGKENIKMKYDN